LTRAAGLRSSVSSVQATVNGHTTDIGALRISVSNLQPIVATQTNDIAAL
jgi:hypothetical protein